ncbi:Proclotting enzyme [Eufriesea mexicana]|uniref:Phenoloxidase-activating factor 2 n=1 Tax=Eufriesea mexicana TaxID=516756 RepID=A0A310SEG9_9HYME|nr:Proclotting enzyme [Eufriesea mexicana]
MVIGRRMEIPLQAGSIRSTFLFYLFCALWFTGTVIDGISAANFAGDIFRSQKHNEPANLRLEKDASTGTVPSMLPTCTGPYGKAGHCEYLKRCFSQDYASNFTMAMDHSCTIERTYLGICCVKHWNGLRRKSTTQESFAEILPLIAAHDDEGHDEAGTYDKGSRIVWSEKERTSTSRPRIPEASRGCGTTWKSRSRLVGGRPADPKEWPWMAALLKEDQTQYCGGVLVTDRHVLTAAHCVNSYKPWDIKVRLGEYDFTTAEETRALDFAVTEIRVHRDFDYTTNENDIAMIKLHRPTVFDSYIWPVCLPPVDQTFENKSAVVTGWGTRYYKGPASTVLMEVGVPVWPQKKCAKSFVQRIPNTTICAGAYEGGRDACQGDSGGPLLHQLGNGRWVNIGIVSWGIRCGEAKRPGIYTRVNSYLDWIFENAVF